MLTSSPSPCVQVVADSPRTIDGLRHYLTEAGVTSHVTRELLGAGAVPPEITAVVLFPDEFETEVVQTTLLDWRSARPELLVVVVTTTPQAYRAALAPDGRSYPPVVLPKPAFGWTLLDSIRGHADRERP
jgi:hypothetical protein